MKLNGDCIIKIEETENRFEASEEQVSDTERVNMRSNKKREIIERCVEKIFLINACVAIFCVIAITFYIFYKGLDPFYTSQSENSYSIIKFLTGIRWNPAGHEFGIFHMIIGSILSTAGAIIIGVPIGLLTAVFIAEIAPKPIKKIVTPAVELLAGIPSVLYGMFGLGVIVPIIRQISPLQAGQSMLAAVSVLMIMILPTVVAISENAIKSVPHSYKEGAYALGASKIQTIFKVIIPAAKSGIIAGIVLGIGRAIGETMAVMMVAGNVVGGLPDSLWSPVRPLTVNIAIDMMYAPKGLHKNLLFSTGVVLFVFILIINLVLNRITSKAGEKQ